MNTLPLCIADIDYNGESVELYLRDDISSEDISVIESIFSEYASPFGTDDEDYGFLFGFDENMNLRETPSVYSFPCSPESFERFRENWCFSERFFCPCMGMWDDEYDQFSHEILFGTDDIAPLQTDGESQRKKFPTFEQLKHYPEWEGINSFLGIDPDSEQGKLNDKEEREAELNGVEYADGTPVGEDIDMGRAIKVYCRTHGEFHVTPRRHLEGEGCPICNRMGENKRYPTKQ